ncbi:hypothetical protein NW755_013407 [Fusarium falciforme]|uniref:Zn(2)-C6 fungal-type domain-containing protein n=1 Tax=Fusarium falciforme TaxID=195108 RepID=A0A9W8USZ7_9HYPO|nr:hypothetical protein NW755_013407 [Fusarium falciforme]
MSTTTTSSAAWQESTRPQAPPSSGSGGIRRIRQACTSCRQRKTKCSGDRPRCMNCRRVNRSCHYESYSATMAAMAANPLAAFPPGFGDPDLLRRLSTIEAQLARLSEQGAQEAR